jgi:hypothetical protein
MAISPKKKKILKKPDVVGGFLMRSMKSTYEGGKNTVVRHGVTGLIALLISSVVPMLQAWHSDKQYDDEIASIRADAANDTSDAEKRSAQLVKDLDYRTDRHIIEVENNEDVKIKAIWDYISKQQIDKNRK